jgi:N utilization substance protein B
LPRKSRRQAREAVLRALYESELGKVTVEQSLENLEAYGDMPEDLQEFAHHAAIGIIAEKSTIDQLISANLSEYDLSRVAAIDRNLLRLAVYELYHRDDIPPKVTLNEAIELAKKYSTAESGKFVNGVLAAILVESPKKNWVPPSQGEVEEPTPPEPEPELVEINEDAPEVHEAAKVGKWKLRGKE